jgi:N-acetylneuraminate synthase/N,N'-diacetyllegionaminate synthase
MSLKIVKIADQQIGEGAPVWVVAEIGNNHDGKIEQARELITQAAEAGCNAVKFQTHIADAEMLEDNTVPPHFPEPRYQFTKRMILSKETHQELRDFAQSKGVVFFSSPFSFEAVDLLSDIDVPAFKLGSGEVTNLPLLEHSAKKRKPVILSTGMSSFEDIDDAVATVTEFNEELILMQCTSIYPCPYEKINLRAIQTLKERYGLPVGFSDHSPEIYTSIAAVALGAVIIEKHFTLDKELYGPDHKASLVFSEMKELVERIREIEAALGTGEKQISDEFNATKAVFEKSLVSAIDIPKNAILTREMLSTKRPGKGLSPKLLPNLIGKQATKDIRKNSLISETDFA